jgi:hypothetical protein
LYESEAKEAKRKQEEKWNEEAMLREQQLKVLMDDRVQTLNERINESTRKQNELRTICENHMRSIEDCNQRLKELMSESLSNDVNETAMLINGREEQNLEITKNINELNGQKYQLTVPKFGRKKIAWT